QCLAPAGVRRPAGQAEQPELLERPRSAGRDAGDRALALGSYRAAAGFYGAALALWPRDDALRPELLLAYARSRVDDVALEDWVLVEAADGLLRKGRVEDA